MNFFPIPNPLASQNPFLARHRIRITQISAVLLLLFSRPASLLLFDLGFLAAVLGASLRTWAAGHIRKSREICQEGPYALVRHPLYLGSLLMASGYCLSVSSPAHALRSMLTWIFMGYGFHCIYQAKILAEETSLEALFGQEYALYRQSVPGIIPDWSLWRAAWETSRFSRERFDKNKEKNTWLGLLAAWVALRFMLVYRFHIL